MKGLFARVSETFSQVNKQINASIASVKNTLSQFSSLSYLVLSSPTVKDFSYNFFKRFWSGFSLSWHPNTVPALIDSPKTRAVLVSSFLHNIIIYGGTVLAYEMSKNLVNDYSPEMEDSYLESALNWGAFAYFFNAAISRTLDNMFGYNGAIAAAAYAENPNNGVSKACSHNKVQQIQGDLTEPLLYLSDIVTLKLLILLLNGVLPSYLWTLAKLLIVPYKALVMGKCMTEYKFGEDKCTEHRERLFSQNKAYLFGVGLSLAMSVEFWNWVIYRYTGVESGFIDDALTSFVGQYFIFVSYTRDRPLPVDERKFGRNLLKYNHNIAIELAKDAGEIIIPRIANPQLRGPLIQVIKKAYSLPISGWVMKILLPKKFQSVETIVKMPGINLNIKYRKQKIEDILKGFQTFRESYGASALVYMPNVIIGENIKNLIKCAMRKEWDDVLEFVKYVLKCAEFEPELVNVKWHVAQGDYQKMLGAPELPRVVSDEQIHYQEDDFLELPTVVVKEQKEEDEFFEVTDSKIIEEKSPTFVLPVLSVTPAADYPQATELHDMIQCVEEPEPKKIQTLQVPTVYPQDNELTDIIHYSDDESEEEIKPLRAGIVTRVMEDYDPVPNNPSVSVGSSKNSIFYLKPLKIKSFANGNFKEHPTLQK